MPGSALERSRKMNEKRSSRLPTFYPTSDIPWINIRSEDWKSKLKMVVRRLDNIATMDEIKAAMNNY